jgi:hypothetical protein
MVYGRSERDQSLRAAAAALAGLYALTAMGLIGWLLLGRIGLADWDGYRTLYDGAGGYLARQGRDPLFVWTLVRAGDTLGGGGYEIFRWGLFGVFTAAAALWAAKAVAGGSGVVVSVLIVIAAFLLKSLVQIREGLAFLFVLVSLAGLFRSSGKGIFLAGLGALVAVFLHVGTSAFLFAWAAALAIWALPDRVIAGRRFTVWLTAGGVAAGLIAATLIVGDAEALEYGLRDFGVDTSEAVVAGFWKYLYWIAMGGLVLVTRDQLIRGVRGGGRFGYVYGCVVAAVLLPMLYVVCMVLVFARFEMVAVASMAIRLLLTSLELALMIIAVRGRAAWVAGGLAVVSIVDQGRLLLI